MFGAPVAAQTLLDRLHARLDPRVPVPGEHLRVALPGQNGPHDGQAGRAAQVAEHVMQLHVHLVEGVVHLPDLVGRLRHQGLAKTGQAAHRANRLGRAKTRPQQAHPVQILQPLAVEHIAFAAGHVPDVPGIDQHHLQAPVEQDLKKRNPVVARAFHGHAGDPAGHQPVRQGQQIVGKGPEGADRLLGSILGHRHADLTRANIDPGGMGMDDGLEPGTLAPAILFGSRLVFLGLARRWFDGWFGLHVEVQASREHGPGNRWVECLSTGSPQSLRGLGWHQGLGR